MTEFTNHNLYHTDLIVICGRVIIIFITLLGWWFTSERYQSYRRFVLLFTFNSISFMLIIISTLVTSQYQHHHHLHDSNYLYSWGPWSLSDSYIFLIICFNCSGLLFSDATTTSGIHILLVLLFPFLLFFNRHPSEIPAPLRLLCLPVLHVIEVVFTQKIEYQNRDRYIGQIERGHLLVSQDHLISSILPSHISKALKSSEEGMTAGEDSPPLAAYYENVTIMFCSIVDFSSQSSLIHPHDTINLSHHLISAMDRIVEQTGAYKVENIGDTFMACAGCPKQTKDHAFVICRTAIAIIQAAEESRWRWPDGSLVSLKIGIHTGAVTGGIVGTKSYSYHLFGDVVNTASRMCSHSVPGKILFSSSTEEAMRSNHPGIFLSHERGQVDVKGKGLMNLFWLDGFQSSSQHLKINHRALSPLRHSKYLECMSSLSYRDSSMLRLDPWSLTFVPTQIPKKSKWTNSTLSVDREHPSEGDVLCDLDASGSLSEKAPSADWSQLSPQEKETVTGLEVVEVEAKYREHDALRNLSRQQNVLGLLVIYSLLQFLATLLDKDEQLLPTLLPLAILLFVRVLSVRWPHFPNYSQQIIVFSSILLSALSRYYSSQSQNYKSSPVAILYILFTSLFLSLRFYFVLLYLILLFVSGPLVAHLARNNQPQPFVDIAYGTCTLILCGLVIYSHEYISRKEFIDIFLLGRELSKSEELLSNLLPSRRHAKQLLQGELVCDDHQDVTLLYSDVKGFTPLAAKLHPLKLCKLLNKIYSAFDDYLSPFGLYKVDTIGDAFVVVGGLSAATPSQSQHGQDQTDHATNSVFFAFYMLECLRRIREKYDVDLHMRIGIHTGPCTGAVVSGNKPRYLVWGPTSITANSMESSGVPDCVHISQQTYNRIDTAAMKKFGIDCRLKDGSLTERTYLLTLSGTELFASDLDQLTATESISARNSDSLFSTAISRLKRINVGRSGASIVPHAPKQQDKLHVPASLFRSPRPQQESPSSGRHRTNSKGSSYFPPSTAARSYEPVTTFDPPPVASDDLISPPILKLVKFTSNPEPTCLPIPLSLNERHINSPTLDFPEGWCRR